MRNNRSNNRSRSSRKDAHKKVIVKYLPFLVLIVGILAIIPWEKIFPSPTPPPSPIQEVFFTKGAEPQLATIYLDNSASMQGYAKGIQYLDALADLMSIYPNTEARLMSNSAMVIKKGSDLISKLANNDINYVGQSLLNSDLEYIVSDIEKAYKMKKTKIAFFVTDGIMCGPDSEIRKDSNYNINHRQDLTNSISDVFKGKGLGVSVYRLVSDFKGVYYCYDNSHKPINALRSFYIVAIGKPEVVSDFKETLIKRQKQSIFKLRPQNEIHFIESKPINQYISINAGTDGNVVLSIDKNNTVVYDRSKIKSNTDINFHISFDAFKNYKLSGGDLAKNVQVTIDGTPYKAVTVVDSLRNAIIVKVDKNRLNGTSGGSKVHITIPYFTPAWMASPFVSNDNDLRFKQGRADESTFFFNYFINGIMNGVLSSSGFNIYDRELLLKCK